MDPYRWWGHGALLPSAGTQLQPAHQAKACARVMTLPTQVNDNNMLTVRAQQSACSPGPNGNIA